MLQVLLHQEHSDQQKHGRSQKQNGIQNFKWQEMLDNPAEAALAEQKENDSGCRAAVQELPIMRVCRQAGSSAPGSGSGGGQLGSIPEPQTEQLPV